MKVICAPVDFISLARYSILREVLRFLPFPWQFHPMNFMATLVEVPKDLLCAQLMNQEPEHELTIQNQIQSGRS
jgi:hypothetical protein